uniref:C2H2-type domain-containing protein n=1 Tax=Clastoptera arizonana TaxID=38151 RepID=A0A1B6ECJ4_9HEMI
MVNENSIQSLWCSKKNSSQSFDVESKCSLCGKLIQTEYCFCSLKKSIECQLCKEKFSDLKNFKTHMGYHQKDNSSEITKKFAVKQTLQSTIVDDVSSKYKSLTNECSLIQIVIEESKKTSSDEVEKSCLKCGEIFNSKLGLIAHSLCHSEKEFNRKEYRCDRCNRDFTSASRLSIHISCTHVKNKKFKCCVCKKGFSTTSTLEAHKRLHLGIKPYKCDECGKAYSQSGNLAYHKSTHSGVKSFVCHLCGKAFLTAGILLNHERRHSGLKPFVCDVCGRAFTDNYSMTSHKIIHTGVRSFMCDCCGKAFVHKHTLASHKRIHTGEKRYKCPICVRAFTQLSTMLQHKNTHTGEKAYTCLCGKSFTQQSSLARHKRLHDSNLHSFSCQLCDKKFSYKSTLYKHHRKNHDVYRPQSFYNKGIILSVSK